MSKRLPVLSRPLTRGDCAGVPRPCPHRWCKWNLFHTEMRAAGKGELIGHWIHPERGETESCVLDIADWGGSTATETAHVLRMTRQRVQQVEVNVKRKLSALGSCGTDLHEYVGAVEAVDRYVMAPGCSKTDVRRYD